MAVKAKLNLFEYMERIGGRKLRKLSNAIPADHPLREAAHDHAMRALEDAAILFLQEQDREKAQAAERAKAVTERAAAEREAASAIWKRGNVKNVKGLVTLFDRLNTAAHFEVADKSGRVVSWHAGDVQTSIKMAETKCKNGGVPALRPTRGACIFGVAESLAATVAKEHGLSGGLSWTVDGWRYWLLSGSPVANTVEGDRVKIVVSAGGTDRARCVSVNGAKWHSKPVEAIDEAGRVKRCPASIRELASAIAPGGGVALDKLLCG